MQKYINNYAGATGIAIKGAQVIVTKPDGSPAAIFSDNGITPITSLLTGADGEFAFYAANGTCTITLRKRGLKDEVVKDVLLYDPADDADRVTDASLAADDGAEKIGYGERPVSDKLGEMISVKDSPFNAKGDGVTNDAAAVAAAHAANKAVRYPSANYVGQSSLSNLYGAGYIKALSERIQAGTPAAPIHDAEPVHWITKFSSADRDINSSEWDNGAYYGALIKKSGSAYGAAITGSVRHEGGTGQMIGVHGRGAALHVNAQVWGGWSYAYNTAAGSHTLIGHEINIKNLGTDVGWHDTAPVGGARGLVITTADAGTTPSQHALYIGRHDGTGGWYTGMLNKENAIQPSNEAVEIGNGEIHRLKGGSSSANRYGGIRFHTGNFQYGISMAEIPATDFLSGCAILLAKGHKIVFGTRPTNGSYLSWTTGDMVNASGATGYGIGGTKVVGPRSTGWAIATGITDKATFATYTAPAISATPTQAEVQAIATACQINSRHLAALINDIFNHGLIGA